MILSVASEKFGIFRDFEIELSEGLNVFTGESGTGKSMFLKLLALLCGREVNLPVSSQRAYAEMLVDRGGIEPEVIAVRWLNGRLNFRFNRKSVRRSELREFCEEFVEFHTQGASQNLPRRFELGVLDPGVPEEIIEAYKRTYRSYMETSKLLEQHNSVTKVDEAIASLSSEIDRLEKIIKEVGDEEAFLDKVRTIENADEISALLNDIDYLLDERLIERLQSALTSALKLKEYGFADLSDRLLLILDMINEVVGMVKRYSSSEEFDISEREAILSLAEALRWAKNRYGPTYNEVLQNLDHMKKELKELAELRNRIASAESSLPNLEAELRSLGEEIDYHRKTTATEVVEEAMEVLEKLGMGNVKMKFEFTPLDDFSPDGISRVRLLIKTLSESEFVPFEVAASGGERSRIYLALHLAKPSTALKERKVLVFDELETGLGQRYADRLAETLKSSASKNQLIVVTHLPQIAAVADSHFLVERVDDVAIVRLIEGDARREEIRAMFGKMNFEEM